MYSLQGLAVVSVGSISIDTIWGWKLRLQTQWCCTFPKQHFLLFHRFLPAGEGCKKEFKSRFIQFLASLKVVKNQGKCVRQYVSQSFITNLLA